MAPGRDPASANKKHVIADPLVAPLFPADPPARLAFVATAAALSALLCILVLLGWAFDVPALRSAVPGAVQTKANTAVALFAASAALWLAAASRSAAWRRLALAAVVASIGLAPSANTSSAWTSTRPWRREGEGARPARGSHCC
jgi:hypothetical protein